MLVRIAKQGRPGLEVIKLDFILILKIKRTRVHKQPIIALYLSLRMNSSSITSRPGLCCLSRHFGQATSVKIFRASTVHFCSLKIVHSQAETIRQSTSRCVCCIG